MAAVLEFTVPKLACAVCVENITQAIAALDAGASVDADPKTKQVKIALSADFAAPEQAELSVRQTLSAAGYPPAE
ncbi:heavy-metal-associated domain-containing protein [Synechococcus sp. PCC 7336]|uniref:heavy-metal-associated domain-containing protein n=1 Tax=Synechococcus sp. PCC 7336 TaxID=195250 RepID=UPI00034C0437|nr:heavy-metal-associated domain-containing protein [Synechococcus sp. PCC 7336]